MEVKMKRIILNGSFAIMAAFVLAAAANAQISTQYRAHIPFDFTVNGDSFGAGDYTVGPMNGYSSQLPIALRSVDHGKTRIIGLSLASSAESTEKGVMRFAQLDGKYSLISVDTPTFSKKIKRTRTDVMVSRNGRSSTIVAVALEK